MSHFFYIFPGKVQKVLCSVHWARLDVCFISRRALMSLIFIQFGGLGQGECKCLWSTPKKKKKSNESRRFLNRNTKKGSSVRIFTTGREWRLLRQKAVSQAAIHLVTPEPFFLEFSIQPHVFHPLFRTSSCRSSSIYLAFLCAPLQRHCLERLY